MPRVNGRQGIELARSACDSIPASMPRNGLQLARRSLQFVRPYRRPLSGVITLALILAALSAIDPLVMKYLFDELERRAGLQSLITIISGLVVLEFTRAGLQAWLGILSWDVRLGVEYTLRERLISKLNSLCPSRFTSAKASVAR